MFSTWAGAASADFPDCQPHPGDPSWVTVTATLARTSSTNVTCKLPPNVDLTGRTRWTVHSGKARHRVSKSPMLVIADNDLHAAVEVVVEQEAHVEIAFGVSAADGSKESRVRRMHQVHSTLFSSVPRQDPAAMPTGTGVVVVNVGMGEQVVRPQRAQELRMFQQGCLTAKSETIVIAPCDGASERLWDIGVLAERLAIHATDNMQRTEVMLRLAQRESVSDVSRSDVTRPLCLTASEDRSVRLLACRWDDTQRWTFETNPSAPRLQDARIRNAATDTCLEAPAAWKARLGLAPCAYKATATDRVTVVTPNKVE